MAKRKAEPALLEYVRVERAIDQGSIRFIVDLDERAVELLTQAIVPEDLAQTCFELMRWKRDHRRLEASTASSSGASGLSGFTGDVARVSGA